MVLEAEEDSSVVRVKPSTKKRESIALHDRDCLIMTTKEERLLQEVEEVKVEIEELLIIATNAIRWDIACLNVQTMEKQDIEENI